MVTAAPAKPKTRAELTHAMVLAMLAGDWATFNKLSYEAIARETEHFNDDTIDYPSAVDDSAQAMTANAQYYKESRSDLAGKALKTYLLLVANAELQAAAANTVHALATGKVERITHPELGHVCQRCKDLEGIHDSDDEDLYWSHPNCHCEWRPVKRLGFATSSGMKARSLTSQTSNRIIGRGKTMSIAAFGKYSKEQREAFVRKGWALPDKESGGAFPIANKEDLKDALHRIGTTNHPRSQVVAFIRKRAKELGAEDMLGDKTAPPASHGVTIQLKDTAVFSKRQTTRDGMVIRRGKVFEAGSRLDMHGIPFVTTQEDLNRMVVNFKPIPVGSGHPEAPSPLDGHLGMVTNLYLGENPNDLYGEVAIPPFVNDILEKQNEGRVSMIFNRHTKEPLGLDFVSEPNVVDAALMAAFAKNQKGKPESKVFMQRLHDDCARRGASCKHISEHARGQGASAVQQVHDITAQHGANCAGNAKLASNRRGRTMDWKSVFKGFFGAVAEMDEQTAKMAGDDPSNDFEADWQEERNGGLGNPVSEQPDDFEANWNEDEDGDADGDYADSDVDEDEEQGASFHPAPLTDANPQNNPVPGTGGEWSTNMAKTNEAVDPNDVKFATIMARNVQLEAELARERANRIEADAVAFADGEIRANRSLPAEREGLIELWRQAAADDAQLGEVKLADNRATSRTERLKVIFGQRDEHWMTKEQLSTTLSPKVIAAAQETARMSVDGVHKPMDAARKAELLAKTEVGKAALKDQKAA